MVGRFLEVEFKVASKIKKIEMVGWDEKKKAVVELEDWETKQRVMREKKKLGKKKIYIDHDLTKVEREVQRKIRVRAKKEREEGKQVKIGYRKVQIQGVWYHWNAERQQLQEEGGFQEAN